MNATNVQRKECECDICGDEKLCSLQNSGKIWACNDCWQKELAAMQNTVTVEQPNSEEERLARYAANPFGNKPKGLPEGTLTHISMNEVLQTVTQENTSIRIRADIFNAKTKSIVDLKDAIDKDETITNKPYALATAIRERFEHNKKIAFEINEKLVEIGNEQRAIQVYMNVLANQLRAEEREKLKISDINYKPQPPKVAKVKAIKTTGTDKSPKTKAPKLDKAALRAGALSLGISEFTLHTVVTARGCSIDEAVAHIKALKEKSGK